MSVIVILVSQLPIPPLQVLQHLLLLVRLTILAPFLVYYIRAKHRVRWQEIQWTLHADWERTFLQCLVRNVVEEYVSVPCA